MQFSLGMFKFIIPLQVHNGSDSLEQEAFLFDFCYYRIALSMLNVNSPISCQLISPSDWPTKCPLMKSNNSHAIEVL